MVDKRLIDIMVSVNGVELLCDENLRFIPFEDAKVFPSPPHVYPWRSVELEDCETEAQCEIHSFLACNFGCVAWGEVLVERDKAGKIGRIAVKGGDLDRVSLLLDA